MKQEHVQPIPITGAVITVSTTRTQETDSSGKTIQAILTEAKIPVQHYAVIPDQIEAIRFELYQALKTCNCIIIDGGTGLTHDDCTIEAVTPLLEKKIDGFGELFRMKSYDEIGTSTMLSRAHCRYNPRQGDLLHTRIYPGGYPCHENAHRPGDCPHPLPCKQINLILDFVPEKQDPRLW